MKITASRKEEILKRKAEYEAAKEAYDVEERRRWNVYRDAVEAITDPIKEELEYNLGKFSALQFRVSVEEGRWREPGLRIHISCDEDRKFNDDVALAWSYTAHLSEKDGGVEPIRESSSWSGLSATTEAQMKSLQQTVKALDYLNSLNWTELLNKKIPEYSELFTDALKRPEREDFESELKEAELDELVGQNKFILVNNFESSGWWGNKIYVKLLRQTPSQYVVIPRHPQEIESPEDLQKLVDSGKLDNKVYERRVRKSNIVPVTPIKVIDIPEKSEVKAE